MTIKEPENNTDRGKMDKIKCGGDKQNKWNEGFIKPHLPTGWEQLSTNHQYSYNVFQDSRNFVENPSTAQLKEHEGRHISQALLGNLCWRLLCVHGVPVRYSQPWTTAEVFNHAVQLGCWVSVHLLP